MNSDAVKQWLWDLNPGAQHDQPEEPWPVSPVAPISDRARQAFRNLGILD